MNVLYEDNHIIVVEKDINIPVQEDASKDLDLLTMIKQYLKEKYNKPGNVYVGLVHRLDRPVGGIMIFAKTSKAASRLSEQVRTNKIDKYYYAVVMGKFSKKIGEMEDHLLKDNKLNITKVDPNGKLARLNYEVVDFKDNYSLVKIKLETGRSHQIRVQFSSRNHPLFGDQKYNKAVKQKEQIALFSYKLGFIHPISHDYMSFELPVPCRYPFTLFK